MGVMKEKIKEWPFAGSLQMQVLLVTSFAGLTILTILTSILWLSSSQQPQHHSHKHDLSVLRTPMRKPRLFSIDNETLFSIVVSEPNAENEKNQIKELLETGAYDANRSLRNSWIRSRRRDGRDGRDGEDRERRRGSNGNLAIRFGYYISKSLNPSRHSPFLLMWQSDMHARIFIETSQETHKRSKMLSS